ncbi:hypothetical protein [Planotetraspora mira]|uniref:DUF1049 domain-containing protein n=1 Tax=Planotetraspora mira TaxID=58121 RepID=A0A8J3U0D1_9ACTN|nr:hypothetical protein [Planotetraspora mira]GII33719.1 hypothetical protein Pmi06nite_71610 [Planotetraspora mira]
MVLLGLLLIIVAAAAMIEVSIDDTAVTMPITILDRTFNLSPFELFLAGAATAVVFLIGLLMVSGGMRRSTAKRRKLREARVAERQRLSQLEAEKRDLERRLEGTGPAADPTAGPTDPATAGPGPGTDPVTARAAERERERAAAREADIREADTREMARPGRTERDRATEPAGRPISVPAQPPDQLVAGRRGTARSDDPGDRA